MSEPAARQALEERLRAALAPHLLLVRELGTGGMGSVFLARDPALQRTVAVKVLAPELAADAAARARFEREAQAVAGLSHPNVVPVYAVGEMADGTPYFVMQHVSGRSLAARLESEGPLEPVEVRRILGEVAGALAAAHAKGIIHRDIKPANILHDDESGRALVSDFGIAAVTATDGKQGVKLTQTGMAIGTPQYMSPEQLLSEPVSEKTDIYSLGLLGYELLTGHGPFSATSPHELIAAYLRDTPKKLSELRDDIDPELDGIVSRCLEKDAARRPSAAEIAKRLAPGGGVLLEWPPPGLAELRGRLSAVSRLFWAASTLILIALLPMVIRGTRVTSAMFSTGSMLLLLAAAIGALLMVAAVRGIVMLGAAAALAVRSGYAWLTLIETLADARGDTGSLIAGTHAFGSLPAGQRDALRRARLTRQLLLLAGGALPLPLLLALLTAGSAGLVPIASLWAAVVLPAACAGAAVVIGTLERRAASPARRRKQAAPATDIGRLSATWYETFEVVRQGQALGRGGIARSSFSWVVPVAIAVSVIIALGLTAQLLFIATIGGSVFQMYEGGDLFRKLRISEVARPYILPADSSIQPLEAGRALFALQGGRRGHDDEFEELDAASIPELPWARGLPDSLFHGYHHPGMESVPRWTVVDSAARRLKPAELAWLERVAHHPVWQTLRVVARAPAVDVLGGRFKVPFSRLANPAHLPPLHFQATKSLAYANSSRVAYYMARGQRDSAELAAREIVSFGFRLVDQGTGLLDVLIGVVVVGIGRTDLEAVYRITANPEAARLHARVETVINATEPTDAISQRAGQGISLARLNMLATVRNGRLPRGARLSSLYSLGMAPCSNVEELIFGLDEDVRSAFATARAELARFPSERSLIDMLETRSERPPNMDGVSNPLARILMLYGDVSGALLLNRRVSGCMRSIAALTAGR